MSWPPAPMIPLTCAMPSSCWSWTSSLVSLNAGTWAIVSYGVAMSLLLRVGGRCRSRSGSQGSVTEAVGDVLRLPHRQGDDRQGGVGGRGGGEHRSVADEQVGHVVRTAPPVDDAALRVRAHPAGAQVVRRGIGRGAMGAQRADCLVESLRLPVGVLAHRHVVVVVIEVDVRDGQAVL